MDIEKITQSFRRELGYRMDTPIDGMTLILKLKRYKNVTYKNVAIEEMPDAEARWNSEKNQIEIRWDTFCGMNAGNPRSVMAVVHEAMHVLLGHKGVLNRASDSYAEQAVTKISPKIRRAESEAKRAAAAFLAPAPAIQSNWTAEDIVRRFWLSKQAAQIRINEVRNAERPKRERPDFVTEFLAELNGRKR